MGQPMIANSFKGYLIYIKHRQRETSIGLSIMAGFSRQSNSTQDGTIKVYPERRQNEWE